MVGGVIHVPLLSLFIRVGRREARASKREFFDVRKTSHEEEDYQNCLGGWSNVIVSLI